jgi:hypothetical protein
LPHQPSIKANPFFEQQKIALAVHLNWRRGCARISFNGLLALFKISKNLFALHTGSD